MDHFLYMPIVEDMSSLAARDEGTADLDFDSSRA